MDIFIDEISKINNISDAELELLERSFILLLTLPIVTTITGIFRYIIGLKSMSVYAPIILTYAFYEMGYIEADGETDIVRGFQFGLALFFIVFIVSTLLYSYLKKVRMHYIPKTTIVLMGVVISIISAMFLGTIIFEKKGLIYLDIFSIIMIATLSEAFVSLLARKTFQYTALIGIQTLFTAMIAYAVISWNQTQNAVVNYSILLIGAILIINLYVGKFLGLRLSEYWRFRDLLLQDTNAKQNTKNKKKPTKDTGAK